MAKEPAFRVPSRFGGADPQPARVPVLSLQVSTLSLQQVAEQVLSWAEARESRTVCAANVHMVMEAQDDPGFGQIVNDADIVTPDGMPLVWALRLQGHRAQKRVYGPALMLETCRLAAFHDLPVGLYGAKEKVLRQLEDRLRRQFPGLRIVYSFSPPFRPLALGEESGILAAIHQSGARILFVGLGCPKQERWMAHQRGRISAAMLGVGAAFDFHAGTLAQAPAWMQRLGLEWCFRLVHEPRRLWKRYLRHNPRFVVLLLLQLVRRRLHPQSAP